MVICVGLHARRLRRFYAATIRDHVSTAIVEPGLGVEQIESLVRRVMQKRKFCGWAAVAGNPEGLRLFSIASGNVSGRIGKAKAHFRRRAKP